MAEIVPQLLLQLPGGEIRIPLDRESTSIGADPACAISFSNLDLNAFHAVIQRGAGGFEVFDLGNGGGLLINGRPEAAGLLKPGDNLRLGSLRAVFLQAASSGATPPAPGAGAEWSTLEDQPFFETRSEAERTGPTLALAEDPGAPACKLPPESAGASAPQAPEARPGLLARLGGLAASLVPGRTEPAPVEAHALDHPHARPWLFNYQGRSHHHVTFTDELIAGLRGTPWVLLSVIAHMLLLILFDLLVVRGPLDEPPLPLESTMLPPDEWVEEEALDEREMEVTVDEEEEELSEEVTDRPDEEPEKVKDWEDNPDEEEAGPDDGPFVMGADLGGQLGNGTDAMGGFGSGGSAHFRRYVRGLRASGLDIVFVIDSTGSMDGVLSDARRRVAQMITVLAQMVPAFRLGLVTYRDTGDVFVTRSVDLTPNRYEVVSFLDGLRAEGGGDHPEDLLSGLQAAIKKMPWSRKAQRLVILVGDAPSHERDTGRIESLVRFFASRKGTLHTIYTPVEEVSGRSAALDQFRKLARIGHGSYVQLAQNQEILLRILEVAFGERNKKDMQARMADTLAGTRRARFRNQISRADPNDVVTMLMARRLPEGLVQELASHHHREFLPAYLRVLGNPKAPDNSRWAAAVLIRRMIAGSSRSPMLRGLAAELRPDRSKGELRALIARLRKLAARAGFPVNLPRQR